MTWMGSAVRLAAQAHRQQVIAAERAYEQWISLARLPRNHRDHLSYPDAAKKALAAYDDVLRGAKK